jgi:hypothetical protein
LRQGLAHKRLERSAPLKGRQNKPPELAPLFWEFY